MWTYVRGQAAIVGFKQFSFTIMLFYICPADGGIRVRALQENSTSMCHNT